MSGLSGLALGLLLVAIGGAFLGLTLWLLRWLARGRQTELPMNMTQAGGVDANADAVLVLGQGGRLLSLNSRARELFNLAENEMPGLERLARRIRPVEAFWGLCAQEGRARITVENHQVDGFSVQLAVEPQPLTVVTLRLPQSVAGELKASGSAQLLGTIPQLIEAMAASLDLDATLMTVLKNVQALIPADFWEITLWDAENQQLVPYRIVGTGTPDEALQMGSERYQIGQGFSGVLISDRQPLLIPDVGKRADIHQAVDRTQVPLNSYLGAPLLVGRELVGTVELGSLISETFTQADLDMLKLISGSAAVAIHNALLYDQEQRRSAELSGLAKLTQAFDASRDSNRLYGNLVQSIAPLLNVDIVGFLLFNETTRSLDGQKPFFGLPDDFIDLYRVPVAVGSPLETALLEQDVIITPNASEDAQWDVLGLMPLASGATLRDSVLVPLTASGRTLGYLQASNHRDGAVTFSKSELNLLMIVANQAAPLIENAALVQQLRLRAQRSETLRRIASLAGSSATLDEVLAFSTQELARLLRSDAALVFLVDEERAGMRLHAQSLLGAALDEMEHLGQMSLDDPQYPFTAAGSQHTLSVKDTRSAQAIIPFYQAIFKKFEAGSAVGVPLLVRNQGVGELWFFSRQPDAFDQMETQSVQTAAGQIAAVVEQAFLAAQTDESLRRRVDQMTALTRISRELGNSLDLKSLLQLVHTEALRATRADCGIILLFETRTSTGQTPAIRFYVGDLPGGALSALEQRAAAQAEAIFVEDFKSAEYAPPHEGVQSAVVVPVLYRQQVTGLISLHARSAGRFDRDTVEVAQSLAAQAAVALGTALQYEEQTRRSELLKRELETISRLYQVSQLLSPDKPLQESLGAIAGAIQEATPFQTVLISLLEAGDAPMLRRMVGAGLSGDAWREISSRLQPWHGAEVLMQPEFKVGSLYFIPADRRPMVPEDIHLYTVLPLGEKHEVDAWDAKDLLLAPLYDAQGGPLGLMSIDAPRDGRRPDRPTLEAIELFAAQAALVMENYRRIHALQQQTAELQAEKERLDDAAGNVRENLPGLLHQQLAQTVMIQKLSRRSERVQAGLEIAEEANRQPDALSSLRQIGQELIDRFDLQSALLAESTASGDRLLEVVGGQPQAANPEALFGQRNPLRQAMQEGRSLVASSLPVGSEWHRNPLLTAFGGQCFIALPVKISAGRSAGVLAIGRRPLAEFSDEDQQIFDRLASQVGVGLQNLNLLTETRRRLHEVNLLLDFSQKIGTLKTDEIMDLLLASLMQVVPAAQSAWVGLAEEKGALIIPRAVRGYADNASLLQIRLPLSGSELTLAAQVFHSGQPRRLAEINFASLYPISSEDLMRYRRATGGRLPVSTLALPVRLGDKSMGALVLENFDRSEAFTDEDASLALSLAQQTALALESARLFQASEQRASQLQALTRAAATITTNLQTSELIDSLLDQLQSVVPYETATLWLRQGNTLSVAAANGFSDSESRVGISVGVQDSALFQEMIVSGSAISVPDVRLDARFPGLLEPDHYSWLAVPLIYKSELSGVIALEKREAGFYTPEHLQTAATFAGQAAVSLENARLFEDSTRRAAELDERSQRLALLNRFSSELNASLEVDYILRLTAQQLITALGGSHAAVILRDENGGNLLHTEVPPQVRALPLQLPEIPLLGRLSETLGIFSSADALTEAEIKPLMDAGLRQQGTQSVLIVPLAYGANLHGWLMLQSGEARRFTLPEIELARTITNQAAIAIQNANLLRETRRLKDDLERRVEERTAELSREHQSSQTMLRIITELSTSLDLDHVLVRTLEVLNNSLGARQSIILLSASNRTYQCGDLLADPAGGLKPEKEVSRWVVRRRSTALVQDIHADTRWNFAEGTRFSYRSLLGVPLVLGEDVLGTLLLLHPEPAHFAPDQVNLIEATARQIAIALNNAELFTLIRDQAENLGGMLRGQQQEASRSRGILEAVADGVLVVDASNQVTLFNPAAEQILGLKASEMMNKPLDQFLGIFGKAATDWFATIRTWSKNPSAYRAGEVYTEQVELENGRIVSVLLSPVVWRNEFLGTVSSFRDITHEVQVDRLKSEFVANVSHELRTPLTSIKGYVDIMLMGAAGKLSEQQKHFLDVVRTSAIRLHILINDLLDLSHIETGQVKLQMKALDLHPLVEEVVHQLRARAQEENKPFTFTVQAPPHLPAVLADKDRLQQVVNALVLNGYNYTAENGQVDVRISQSAEEVRVEVRDNGIGILEEDKPRIFERFYRGTDPLVLATAGTGLGLAMAKTLVEMHHGSIGFESSGKSGEGSTFFFTLPIIKEDMK